MEAQTEIKQIKKIVRYECPECDARHKTEQEAMKCCSTDGWGEIDLDNSWI